MCHVCPAGSFVSLLGKVVLVSAAAAAADCPPLLCSFSQVGDVQLAAGDAVSFSVAQRWDLKTAWTLRLEGALVLESKHDLITLQRGGAAVVWSTLLNISPHQLGGTAVDVVTKGLGLRQTIDEGSGIMERFLHHSRLAMSEFFKSSYRRLVGLPCFCVLYGLKLGFN